LQPLLKKDPPCKSGKILIGETQSQQVAKGAFMYVIAIHTIHDPAGFVKAPLDQLCANRIGGHYY
jgi:hypothetical protein